MSECFDLLEHPPSILLVSVVNLPPPKHTYERDVFFVFNQNGGEEKQLNELLILSKQSSLKYKNATIALNPN
jgi:hypothetical protein